MEKNKISNFVSFKKCVDIVFIFTWKTSLFPKFKFPSECKIHTLIFVDENKDHISNEYRKLNLKNIYENYLFNGWTSIMVESIYHTYNTLTSLSKKIENNHRYG